MKNKLKIQLGVLVLSAMAAVAFFATTDKHQRHDLLASNVESKAGILAGPTILTEFMMRSSTPDPARNAGPLCEMSDAIVTKCGTADFILQLAYNGGSQTDIQASLSGSASGKAGTTKGNGEGELNFNNNNNKGFTASIGSQNITFVFRDNYLRWCTYQNGGYCVDTQHGEDCMTQYAQATAMLVNLLKGKK